jgi:membrane-bound metal-dependent hydrolase YbcI (DUF457 family)
VKGIAHFVTGVAVATFFPQVVHGAAQNPGFGPLLGGFAGLLPDTLDFKFLRYFERPDDEIDPARIVTPDGRPDPQAMAERIAAAMNRAHHSGRRVTVHLHTLRLAANRWRRYRVAFDLEHDQVLVQVGPAVTTAGVPYPESDLPGLAPGRAQVLAPIHPTYTPEMTVDVFGGPSLAFDRVDGPKAASARGQGDQAVEVTFLPWHRAWSHSLALVLGLGLVGWFFAPVYGLVMALAALAHVLEDQLGLLGSNLFFPFTRRRVPGLGLIRSGDAVPNFLAVWIGLVVILLNLDRFSGAPSLPILPCVVGAIVAPALLFLAASAWQALRRRRLPARALTTVEILDESSHPE